MTEGKKKHFRGVDTKFYLPTPTRKYNFSKFEILFEQKDAELKNKNPLGKNLKALKAIFQ